MKVPFGKFKGMDLRDVEASYLGWLIDLQDLKEPFRTAVCEELIRRAGGASKKKRERDERYVTFPSELRAVATEIIRRGFRQVALEVHPDRGGSHDGMVRAEQASDLLRKLVGG